MNLDGYATTDRDARIALSLLTPPAMPVTGQLVARYGAQEALGFATGDSQVEGVDAASLGVWRTRIAEGFNEARFAERWRNVQQAGFTTLIPSDPHWPGGLNDLSERAPLVLWARGATSFLARPLSDLATLTGMRASTSYGNQVAGDLASGTCDDGKVVVSGGGYGIDAAAHRAALAAGGDTIAVMAGGLDRLHPLGNSDLLGRVGDVGLLVSESPPGVMPTRSLFLARTRVLAALSAGTVIVEATMRSGALAVAQQALQLGRPVGAVPGPVTSIASAGANRLLQQVSVRPITSAADITSLCHEVKRTPPTTSAGLGATSPSLGLTLS